MLTDGDRFAIALAEGLMQGGVSERQAYDLAAGVFGGDEMVPTDDHEARGAERGMSAMVWSTCTGTGNSVMAGIAGRATTLWQKRDRAYRFDNERQWIENMATGFRMALAGQVSDETLRMLASRAGEPMAAETILIPLVNSKRAGPN